MKTEEGVSRTTQARKSQTLNWNTTNRTPLSPPTLCAKDRAVRWLDVTSHYPCLSSRMQQISYLHTWHQIMKGDNLEIQHAAVQAECSNNESFKSTQQQRRVLKSCTYSKIQYYTGRLHWYIYKTKQTRKEAKSMHDTLCILRNAFRKWPIMKLVMKQDTRQTKEYI